MKIWPDFTGYGFNLQSQHGPGTQFIGHVDKSSPAEAAGLLDGDRVIEVNGQSTADLDHGQAVAIIKSVPGETKLLVLDTEAFAYYKAKDIRPHGGMVGIKTIVCPDSSGQGKQEGGACIQIFLTLHVATSTTKTAFNFQSLFMLIRGLFASHLKHSSSPIFRHELNVFKSSFWRKGLCCIYNSFLTSTTT